MKVALSKSTTSGPEPAFSLNLLILPHTSSNRIRPKPSCQVRHPVVFYIFTAPIPLVFHSTVHTELLSFYEQICLGLYHPSHSLENMNAATDFLPGYLAEDQSARLMNLCIALIVLEVLFVALFITSRIRSETVNGWDTYLVPLALPFCVMEAACGICK
jgi:hypothetical protein